MQVSARATLHIGALNGSITERAVGDAAMASIAGMPDGLPLDIHMHGDVRFVSPLAFGCIADLLIRAESITVHAPGSVVADITRAIATAVEQEQRCLARKADPDPVLAKLYRDMGDSLNGGA